MKISFNPNISAKIDVRPHKVSKRSDLPTINEVSQVDFGGRTRAQMRRLWMNHARMTGLSMLRDINFIEVSNKHIRLHTGLSMLEAMNRDIRK